MPVTSNTRKLAALLGASGAGIGTDGLLQAAGVDANLATQAELDALSFAGLADATVSTSDPALNSNPSATGHVWFNKTTGESYVCSDATGGANVWKNTNANRAGIGPAYVLSWLVIAGGGSGGGYYRSGGGGAGGYRNSFNSETSGAGAGSETAWTVTPATTGAITVVVGGGGQMVQQVAGYTGAAGSASSITAAGALAAGTTPISSAGGGGGGSYQTVGAGGGSGGGAGHNANASPAGGGGTGSQGHAGGNNNASGYSQGASGGGAASAGGVGGTNNYTFGGTGMFSHIDGFKKQRAAGGGGGSYAPCRYAFGGQGGGGQGGGQSPNIDSYSRRITQAIHAIDYYLPTDGEIYTGSGGGGTAGNIAGVIDNKRHGHGATGIVILRMPSANYSGTTTGSPIITQVGTDTVLQFIGNGTYTT
jgi:hypothetical protein